MIEYKEEEDTYKNILKCKIMNYFKFESYNKSLYFENKAVKFRCL